MTCDRCQDIHQARREGKSNHSCDCDCHYCSSGGIEPLMCTCERNTTGVCPLHPFWSDSSGGAVDTGAYFKL